MKIKNKSILLYIYVFILILLLGFNVIQILKVSSMYDFKLRWQECAYVLKGVNPFDSISGLIVIDSIGKIDEVAGTVPWAYLLGNGLVAGFLDYPAAELYFRVMFILSAFICFGLLWKKYYDKTPIMTAALFSFWSLWAIARSWILGNYGAVCCFLIIISILIYKRNWQSKIIASILLAIAMCKPQIAGLFALTYLMIGEYAIVLIAALIDIFSWGIVAILTNTNPLNLLIQILYQGTGYNNITINDGIFTILRNFGISATVILALSAILGCALCLYAVYQIKKHQIGDSIILFAPAAVLSCIWFYHHPYDNQVLIVFIVGLAFLFNSKYDMRVREQVILYSAMLICLYGYLAFETKVCSLFFRFNIPDILAMDLAVLLEDIAYILCYGVLIWRVKANESLR